MERVMDAIRERPWLLVIPLALIIYLVVRRRPAAETTFVPVAAPAETGAGGGEGEAMALALSQMAGMVSELGARMEAAQAAQVAATSELMAEQQAAWSQMLAQQTATLKSILEEREERQIVVTQMPPAVSEQVYQYAPAPAQRVAPVTETIPWYYGGETIGQKTVTATTAYEREILEAKKAYWAAHEKGDVAGMQAAHEAAERVRQRAKAAGVTLAEWAATASGK